MEMERSMLKAKHFPNDYWVEVVACATYILNRCPTKSVQNIVPEEAWSGRKHSVARIRVFGCVAYAHVSDELRKKLDNKAEKCLFVGYSDESKEYKLYNPLNKKVIINRDVQFIEEEAWDGILEKTVNVKACIPHEDKEELTAANDPINFEDAVKEEKWVAAMEEEIEAIENNDTWELVNLPQGKHVIAVKWVYKTKSNVGGKIERHKARLVVKGYK
eukprot:PITA_31458